MNPCLHPFDLRWAWGPGDASFEEAPACQGVELRRAGDGLELLEDDEGILHSPDAYDAVAFRDASGIGMVTADALGRYYLHVPGRSARILVGSKPEGALQWGLLGVHVGPDGWWVRTFATWVRDHYSERPPSIGVFFVSRTTLGSTLVDWPFFEGDRFGWDLLVGGLDLRVEAAGRIRTLQIRWRTECAPAADIVVTPPAACQSWVGEGPWCFGRC